MSDGANKAFKKNPAEFLKNNVILIREGGMPGRSGCYQVNLRSAGLDTVTDHNGRQLAVWVPYLAQTDPTKTYAKEKATSQNLNIGSMELLGASKSRFSNQFKAFYIPWGVNATHTEDLDDRADFMFTPGLSGCSFAATGGGRPRAGHFNYHAPGTDRVSPELTAAHVRQTFGDTVAIGTKRADYIETTGNLPRSLVIVGWRESKLKWRFYRQHLEFAGSGKGRNYKRLAAPSEITSPHEVGSA